MSISRAIFTRWLAKNALRITHFDSAGTSRITRFNKAEERRYNAICDAIADWVEERIKTAEASLYARGDTHAQLIHNLEQRVEELECAAKVARGWAGVDPIVVRVSADHAVEANEYFNKLRDFMLGDVLQKDADKARAGKRTPHHLRSFGGLASNRRLCGPNGEKR